MKRPDLKAYFDNEWIMTNGLGGYALGFGNMLNKRKYNGLLISSDNTFKRMHIISSIEEKVELENNYFFMDSNHYKNCIYPNGWEHIVRMWMRPYPAILYSSYPFDKRYLILKEIFMVQGKNAVVVKYTNMFKLWIKLVLRPKFTMRNHHFVNTPGTFDSVRIEKKVDGNSMYLKRHDNACEAFIYAGKGDIIETHVIYNSVYYPIEAQRGYESVEDLVSPARIDISLAPYESASIVFSSYPVDNFADEAEKAEKFYKSYPLPKSHPAVSKPSLIVDNDYDGDEFDRKSYLKILNLAASEFVVGGSDIIAGYPWFGPWGRDTLISMGGLSAIERGNEIAEKILARYGASLKDGLLPNTFGEGGEGINYASVDAPLWYVLRAATYCPRKKDIFRYVSAIILNYLKNDALPFYTDVDGLINIREGDTALTWMDAKVHGFPVTPRHGKPVEIEALWFNALLALRDMAVIHRVESINLEPYSLTLSELEDVIVRVKDSLQKFVGEGYLADRIENDKAVWEVRPNAVIALSLPYDFVSKETMRKVWETAKKELLTQYGLRSLSPESAAFKRKYIGNQRQRDLSYHQGTVWAYLLLPFVRLTMKVLQDEIRTDEIRKEIGGYLWSFRSAFMKGEIASVAEIWDGIDPYFPKGCPSQAWSVFALLEAERMISEDWGK